MTFHRASATVAAILLGALFAVQAATANDRASDRHLPGVEEGYRIVDGEAGQLPPEPEPDGIPGAPGSYRVGDWDVTISGSVSFEIGTGQIITGR